ncbi:hypothetical protein M0813_15211 [Anaeramoeba flamelloides]|uniref:Uncharacterized protein n=1 Tax=Anaeramoeba flamelloides TaxID=1746091 RepID=A0ABQ8Z2Y3_9EUKA|nr:hypothetical protein M0813_15211 [Anaeramoeba flamelloides]
MEIATPTYKNIVTIKQLLKLFKTFKSQSPLFYDRLDVVYHCLSQLKPLENASKADNDLFQNVLSEVGQVIERTEAFSIKFKNEAKKAGIMFSQFAPLSEDQIEQLGEFAKEFFSDKENLEQRTALEGEFQHLIQLLNLRITKDLGIQMENVLENQTQLLEHVQSIDEKIVELTDKMDDWFEKNQDLLEKLQKQIAMGRQKPPKLKLFNIQKEDLADRYSLDEKSAKFFFNIFSQQGRKKIRFRDVGELRDGSKQDKIQIITKFLFPGWDENNSGGLGEKELITSLKTSAYITNTVYLKEWVQLSVKELQSQLNTRQKRELRRVLENTAKQDYKDLGGDEKVEEILSNQQYLKDDELNKKGFIELVMKDEIIYSTIQKMLTILH